MNQTINIALKQHQQVFKEVEQNWNLPQLLQRLEAIKLHKEQEPLTDLEQFCLKGILCGYTPEEIAQKLIDSLDPFLIQVTFWNLFRYIQTMLGKEEIKIANFQELVDSLAVSEYKSEADTVITSKAIELPNSIAPKNNVGQPKTDPKTSREIVAYKQTQKLALQANQQVLEPVDENDFMPSVSPWTRLGGMFLVGSIGVAIALAALTPYRVTVKANSTIRPDDKINLVQAETSGTIVSLQARENQAIKKGDVIATIDNSALETEVGLLQNQIQQGKLQQQQLFAQISAIERQIIAERERIQNEIAEAELELNRTRRDHRDRMITTSAQVEEARANYGLARAELAQAQAELQSVRATLESQKAAMESAKSKLDRYRAIAASGALSKDLLDEAALNYQQLRQQVEAQKATVLGHQGTISRQQQAIVAAQARLNNMGAGLNPSNAEVEIARKRISQFQASGEVTIAALNREQEALKQQAIDIQKQLERHQKQLRQASSDRDRTVIKAPTNGTLFQLNLHNPGQNVQAGTEIARIASENASLQAKAYVNPQDINQVIVGQPARLKISACPYPDYGVLKGTVTQISPDAISVRDNTSGNAIGDRGLYEVTIEPESSTLKQGNARCDLQLGMEGRADLLGKEETVLKFLLRKARLIVDL